jgi:uncharacterized phage protein gp47/JayE
MPGLSATGFTPRTVDELRALLEDRVRTRLGATTDVSAESLVGQLIAVCATVYGELWEGLEAVYAARDPRGTTGAALESLAALCPGIARDGATKGTVTLRLNVAAATTIPAGAVAHVTGEPGSRWVTTEAAVNAAGTAANVDVEAEAELAGRYLAPAGTITVIATPVSGWNSVTNPEDAVEGQDVESYTAMRARRERTLQRAGSSPLNAIAAQVAEVTGVTDCLAWENTTSYVDADGRPPGSVEVMVLGGTDAAIATAILAAKAGGIRTHGTDSATVADANGQSREISFSRPDDVDVYVTLAVTTDPDTYAGDTAVEDAVLDLSYGIGETVRISDLVVAVREVTGVRDVTVRLGETSLTQANANLLVGPRERAVLDSSRLTVKAT